jgi:hypothetical protein
MSGGEARIEFHDFSAPVLHGRLLDDFRVRLASIDGTREELAFWDELVWMRSLFL